MKSRVQGTIRRLEARARRSFYAADRRAVNAELRAHWEEAPQGVAESWTERLRRDRTEIIPWLDATQSLAGRRVLEIGCGLGASTFALAEQGATVVALDVEPDMVGRARELFAGSSVRAEFVVANAADTEHVRSLGEFDSVIFWASLEHMTIAERLAALPNAWDLLATGGLLTLVETPNRLWPHDSHTSQLPFFNWLPDDLAFAYARFSSRPTFGGETYSEPAREMVDFLRRGRGVSFHEFDLSLGPDLTVRSCMQLERRARRPSRRVAWALSSAGRTERQLRGYAPGRHAAWFQPFLYLTIEKG